MTTSLAAEAMKLPPQRQALLLLAIGDRKDTAPLSLFSTASKSPSAVVREAVYPRWPSGAMRRRSAILLNAALNDAEAGMVALERT